MFLRKRLPYVLLILAILALIPLWLLREPSYQGRSLSEWLNDTAAIPFDQTNLVKNTPASQAVAAIRGLGPKAVPHLTRMLSANQTRFSELRREIVNTIVRRRNHLPSIWELRRRGFVGLYLLGPKAAPAVPEILGFLEQSPDRIELWYLLVNIGPASVSAAPLFERTYSQIAHPDFQVSRPNPDFNPQWIASELYMAWGGTHRERLSQQLTTNTNSLGLRLSSLWSLRKDPEFARQLAPALLSILGNRSEPPLLKVATMHALGRIPSLDSALAAEALEKYEAQFGALATASIRNGDFVRSDWIGTNQIPADPRPASALYTNWLTWNGVVGRSVSPTPPTPKIDLGPRSPPGFLSQVVRTTPGAIYQITFDAVAGRNKFIKVTAGDLDKIFFPASSDLAKPSQATFEFRAQSTMTTLTIGAVEFEGFGPFIDNVMVQTVPP